MLQFGLGWTSLVGSYHQRYLAQEEEAALVGPQVGKLGELGLPPPSGQFLRARVLTSSKNRAALSQKCNGATYFHESFFTPSGSDHGSLHVTVRFSCIENLLCHVEALTEDNRQRTEGILLLLACHS